MRAIWVASPRTWTHVYAGATSTEGQGAEPHGPKAKIRVRIRLCMESVLIYGAGVAGVARSR